MATEAETTELLPNAVETEASVPVAASRGETDEYGQISGDMPESNLFSRLLYSSCYGLSYGVSFPVLLLLQMVPMDNVVVHGLVDGAAAARERVERRGMSVTGREIGEAEGLHIEDGEADSVTEAAPKKRPRSPRRGGNHKAARSSRKS